jgi:hypothetical protein
MAQDGGSHRRPNVQDFGLKAAGIRCETDRIVANRHLRTIIKSTRSATLIRATLMWPIGTPGWQSATHRQYVNVDALPPETIRIPNLPRSVCSRSRPGRALASALALPGERAGSASGVVDGHLTI